VKPRDKPYLLEALQEMLAKLPAPAMLRPDLGTLRGRALLDAVAKLEAEGELVVSGGALVHWSHSGPAGRLYFERGIMFGEVIHPLEAAGLPRRREGSLCE
jgi:hypothetical protein